MYAIQNEHVMVVKELLLAGADATAKDRSGRSVNDMATDKGNREIIDLLSRQTAVSNPNDPFVQLLSGYLQQKAVTDRGAEVCASISSAQTRAQRLLHCAYIS